MLDTDWDYLKNIDNVDGYYSAFMRRFSMHYEEFFPLITKRIQHPHNANKRHIKRAAPWFTPEIKKAINKRNRLARTTRTGVNMPNAMPAHNFRKQRNIVVGLIKKAKRAYYEKRIGDCLDAKGKWRDIDKILGKKGKSLGIEVLEYNGGLINDDSDIASSLGEYFKDEPEKIIEGRESEGLNGTTTALDFSNSFFLMPSTSLELKTVVAQLRTDKATGKDGISPIVLKNAIDGLVTPLVGLANLMFSTGTYPSELKISRILPIHKKGERTNMANYRPISLISIFAKILERMIYNRIKNYLRTNGILAEEQFGFRDRRSTELALLDFWDGVINASEVGMKTLAIYLDLSRAFDCINHRMLLNKMYAYGLRGKLWDLVKSYLTDRSFMVRVGNTDSRPISINRGVPQGSSLGPLLFIIFINDLIEKAKGIQLMLYADDITCILSGNNVERLIREANEKLESIVKWMTENELAINYQKSKYMIFGGNDWQPQNDNQSVNVTLNGYNLDRVFTFRLLGIWFDADYKWRTHYNSITKTLAMEIGRIRAVSRVARSTAVLLQMYYAFVHSRIVYGITLWGNSGSTCDNAIILLQKRCIRIALGLNYRDPVMHTFATNRLLSFSKLFTYRVGMIMHGIIGKTIPVDSLYNLFTWIRSVHTYETRNSDNLYIQGSKTNRGWRSFRNQGPLIWNSIPKNIKNLRSAITFKKEYMSHLLQDL